MADKDQQLIAYCLKQGYLSIKQARQFTALKARGKNIIPLIAKTLGWDKAQARKMLQATQQQTTQGNEDTPPTSTTRTQFGKYLRCLQSID